MRWGGSNVIYHDLEVFNFFVLFVVRSQKRSVLIKGNTNINDKIRYKDIENINIDMMNIYNLIMSQIAVKKSKA